MNNNQFYVAMLALLALSTQPAYGMMSPARVENVLDRDAIIEQLDRGDAAVEATAQNICSIALQRTEMGRTFFHVPRYEQYLNRQPNLPWQALFMANARMIDAIESQQGTRYHQGFQLADIPSGQFKHLQRAIIYCETARELLKRKKELNPANASIASLKEMAKNEYKEVYKHEPAKLRKALHVASHRWNDCKCNNLYTAPLSRNIRK